MSSSSFYKRYKMFLGAYPVLRGYLRWVYCNTLVDFSRFSVTPNFHRVLLCGTSGEVTSSIFSEHIQQQNPDARITILDAGEEQIRRSEERISATFPDADVHYIIADARASGIPDASIDFIDTDFLFVYLDSQGLDQLFTEWRRILAPGGTVAFRTFATRSILSSGGSALMNLWCKVGLGAAAYSHSFEEIEGLLQKHGFEYRFAGRAFLPFGYRVIAVKSAGALTVLSPPD
jgi:ubiquinone/menaquinone biosynthesis C-methylase UbiE